MEEVTSLARVSKGTLYRYFASKEQLLLATILDSYEQFLPLVEPGALTAGGALDRLEALLDGMVKVLDAVGPRMPVHYQAWGLVAKDPDLEARLHGFLRDFHEERGRTLEATIRAGQREGVFRPDADVAALVESVQALLSGFLYRATFDPARAHPELLRRAFASQVLDPLVLPGAAGDPVPAAGASSDG